MALNLDIAEMVATGEPPQSITVLLESLPETRRLVVQAWIDGLKATKWSYDMKAGRNVYEPDHRERRENAKLLASYLDGVPAQTVIVKAAGSSAARGPAIDELKRAIQESPAFREAVQEIIDDAKTKALPA